MKIRTIRGFRGSQEFRNARGRLTVFTDGRNGGGMSCRVRSRYVGVGPFARKRRNRRNAVHCCASQRLRRRFRYVQRSGVSSVGRSECDASDGDVGPKAGGSDRDPSTTENLVRSNFAENTSRYIERENKKDIKKIMVFRAVRDRIAARWTGGVTRNILRC